MYNTTPNYSNHQLKYEIQRLRYAERHSFATPIESNVLASMEAEWQRRYNAGLMGKT